jgi:hypothetical protein
VRVFSTPRTKGKDMERMRKIVLSGVVALTVAGCAAPDAADEASDAEERAIGEKQQAMHKVDNGYLPHNVQRRFRAPNGCEFLVQHGNYIVSAYAKAQFLTPGCQGRVSVAASQNGALVGNTTVLFGVEGGLHTAQVDWANIIGTEVTITNVATWEERVMAFAGI